VRPRGRLPANGHNESLTAAVKLWRSGSGGPLTGAVKVLTVGSAIERRRRPVNDRLEGSVPLDSMQRPVAVASTHAENLRPSGQFRRASYVEASLARSNSTHINNASATRVYCHSYGQTGPVARKKRPTATASSGRLDR
jgi:hypothetical protein